MADDALKQTILDVDFIDGEQPSAVKLTNMVSQLKTSVEKLSRAVGDLLSQQSQASSTGTPYDLNETHPLVGPSLARILGSAGELNPRYPGRNRITDREVIFTYGFIEDDYPATFQNYEAFNKRQFRLPYWPIVITSAEGADSFAYSTSVAEGLLEIVTPPVFYTDATGTGTGKIVNASRVANLSDLNAAGEWHISTDGIITLYSALATGEGFQVTYSFDPIPDLYDGAYPNVYPDFSQTATLCTVAAAGSDFDITIPVATIIDAQNLTTASPYGLIRHWHRVADRRDPSYNLQYTLPDELTDNLVLGDVIPSGYIYLYDETTDQILSGGVFTYRSTTVVRVSGLTLTASTDRYRLIVGGASAAPLLRKLKNHMYSHNHSGTIQNGPGVHMGQRVSHADLLNLIDEGTDNADAPGFVPSLIGPHRNPHPQYLHRYGFQYAEDIADAGNLHNALMGSLVLGNIDSGLGTTADSWSIYFGGSPTLGTYGGRIKYDQSDDQLQISGKPVNIGTALTTSSTIISSGKITAQDGISSGSSDTQIRWATHAELMPVGGNAVTISIVDPGDISDVIGVSGSVLDATGKYWNMQRGTDEAATRYLYTGRTEIVGGNIEIDLFYGDDLRSGTLNLVLWYY